MRTSNILPIILITFISLSAAEYQEWVKIQFDPNVLQIQMMVQDGTIESGHSGANQGWMLSGDYDYYSNYFNFQRLDSELRKVEPPRISSAPDSVGEVIAIYPDRRRPRRPIRRARR